ncbi:response regulator [Legionella lytica]|uniref:histidine kinase n=1 Tax=Legionella lytica TaxID=96232 RepID=A0ABY4Y8J0_9GAMM|nr:ATP-binding protein [Legionella lytica]USQ13816.1 response regulator [Legionella lytica]
MNITRQEIPNFGKAYDLLNVSFIILNPQLHIDYINDAARNILHLTSKPKHAAQSFFELWSALELPALLDEHGKIINPNPTEINGIFLSWKCIAVQVDNEEKLFLLGKDVTEKERMFQSMERACEQILGFKFKQRYALPYYINEVYNYLNGIINKIPCYVYWKNRDLQYIGCNQMAADFINLQSTDDIIGKTDFDVFNDWELAKEYRATDEQIFATGKAVINEPGQLVNDAGDLIHTLVSKVPIFNQAGEVMGLAGISVDVTDLTKAQVSSELANKVKTEFIANMSHDIRTPLTGVVGMAKLLEDNLSDASQKQYAHWLGESGTQLLSMLNGILDVVSADNVNEADVHEEPFDLRQLVHNIEQLERPSTLIKGLDFVASIDERVPSCLISDATKIHRILLNLLGNAIKFTQAGRVEITLDLLAQNETHSLIRFHITDTGIGIPEELQDKIFDRFYRGTPSNKGTYTGHGVGLHIAQSYVALLGGEIQVSSELGKGTSFHFDLSLKTGESRLNIMPSRVSDGMNNNMATASGISPTPKPYKLLLVEDNKIALFTLENLIKLAGYQFTSVMDGESALHLAKNQSFDLIITDLGLPGLSGIDLTRKIREFERELHKEPMPIIGLTAHSEEKIKRSCLESGMNEVFTKPMTTEMLAGIKTTYFSETAPPPVSTKPWVKTEVRDSKLLDSEEYLFQLDGYKLFNVNRALEDMGGDINLLRSILTSIIDKETPADLFELEQAHRQNDWHSVQKLVHRIKSGFVYCGAEKLVQACQYLERYYKTGHSFLLEALYKQLLTVVEETRRAVRSWLLSN